jgi:hypothetical protein
MPWKQLPRLAGVAAARIKNQQLRWQARIQFLSASIIRNV